MAELHMPHGAETAANHRPTHEETDVDIRAIFGFGAALIIVAVAIYFMVWLLFGFFESRAATRMQPQYPLAAGENKRVPPEPRLQTAPREDLREMREGEDAILKSYGWVDKNAGVVRIPIEEAMKLVVQRGLPARPGPKQ
jgi:hypothetical protein